MKSTLLKTTVMAAAALALGALASPAAAKTLKYTFATASGSAYCDGITLTTSDKLSYAGTHTGSCLGVNDHSGGFAVKIGGGKYVEATAAFTGFGNTDGYLYYLDTANNYWYLFLSDGVTWNNINSGMLLKGEPPAGARGGQPSVHPKAGAKIEKMRAF